MGMIEDRTEGTEGSDLRAMAVERLERKRDFHAHLLAYVLVNAMLIGIWFVSGADFFWPIFPLLGWGIGLGFHAWDTYRNHEITEEQIEREMRRLGGR